MGLSFQWPVTEEIGHTDRNTDFSDAGDLGRASSDMRVIFRIPF